MSDSEYEDDITTNDVNDLSFSPSTTTGGQQLLSGRYAKFGYKPQKELQWNKYLPYADKLDDESQQLLANIKENLAKAVAMRDIKPGVGIYASRLIAYIRLYNLKFSKEDHIKFIKLFIELICLEDLEPANLNKFCIVLNQLMKKPYILSPDDLEIEWRPLYRLFEIYLHKTSNRGNFYQFFSRVPCNLKSVIRHCSVYFPKSSVKEILDEILPKLQPLDTGKSCQIFEILNLFLNFRHDYELWLDDFMNIWNTYQNPPWSEDMMNIMGNVAYENIGKINWEPYLPVMFSRILRWLDLPVNYKNLKMSRNYSFCSTSIAKWIVAVLGPTTSGQKYLTKFIGAIESYLHPANFGKWIKSLGQLLVALPEYFIDRLEYERFRKPSWMEPVPESYKLTEKCITEFVESLKSAAFQAMYSRIDSNDVCKIFRHLSNLRPEMIIPGVIDRVYLNLESLTEPHRLTASLQCLVGISRSLICGLNGYANGRTHVIPILFAALPGIDPNDIRKAFLTMNFYGAFLFQMPIIDCSKAGQYYDDLTEDETLICEQTANLEDFVLQFIDRLFVMIKYNTQESVRMEQSNSDNNKSRYDLIIESSMSSGLQVILGQCSEEILLSAAHKVTDFVQNNLLDPHTGATLLGTLVNSVAQIAGPYTFKTLVPYLTDKLLNYIQEHDDVEQVEKQSDDFLYYLTILFHLYKGDPRESIKYIDDYLIPILDKIMKFKCKITQKITCGLIFNVLTNLSRMQIFDNRSMDENLKKPLSEYLPIRHWGEKMKSNDKILWYTPNENECKICEKLLHRYLPSILDTFNQYSNNDIKNLDREDILRDLNYILSFLSMSNFLPFWDEPLKELIDTVVDRNSFNIITGFENLKISMPNNDSVRLTIIDTLNKLQKKLLEDNNDDIQSLRAIIMIWDRLHLSKSYVTSYENELKSYKYLRQFQEYKLTKFKGNIKAVAIKRILIQQLCRDELKQINYTESHGKILKNLLELATSYYSGVRILAQQKLFHMINLYPFSYLDILDDLIELLKLDSTKHHESFKGALYIIIGTMWSRILIKNDWKCIEKIWLQLLKTKPSEKPSIVRLLDAISYIVNDEFTTITIEIDNLPNRLIENALKLIDNSNNNNTLENEKLQENQLKKKFIITNDDMEIGKKKLEEKNLENRNIYLNILNSILDITKNMNLHWRYHLLATTMIQILVHPKIKYPSSVANYIVNNLINDSIKERKLSINILNTILEQQKRKQLRIEIDPFEIAGIDKPNNYNNYDFKLPYGIRPDNLWLQYNYDKLPKSQDDWDKPEYLHKSDGFFGWSSNLKVYAPYNQQPSLDRDRNEMNETEQIIYDFFKDKKNLDKFIKFWSLEENKGKEKFKQQRFALIKYLFKIYGDAFLDDLIPYLENLIKENKHESNHRCAAEILSGIMRGMKHWPYDKTRKAYEKILPLIRLALDNITVETDDFWGTCFATASEHIDPRKQYWLHEVLMENPLRESTSFVDCCRIFCLQGPFNQHVWRMDSYAHRLLDYLKPYLNHQFQNVRVRLGSILINIFEADLKFKNGNEPQCPRTKDMITEVIEKLKPLNKEISSNAINSTTPAVNVDSDLKSEEQKEYDEAVRLFKTISQWIIGIVSRNTNGNETSYFDLLPFACRFESSEQDAELAEISTSLLALISQALTLPDRMEYALNKIDEISKSTSWNSRLAVIDALQVLVFHNMAIISSNDEWVQKVQNIVLRLLEDTSLEVREKAAQVLGGLLHCSFLPATDKLLEQFKRKCKTKVVRRNIIKPMNTCSMEARSSAADAQDADAVRMRHTGVLGLCAFISAFPYDIPDFVPDVFEHLGAHLNDPQPIPSTIRKTVGDFKRTHHENWAVHQLKFTEDQLEVLSDLTIPPSYYS